MNGLPLWHYLDGVSTTMQSYAVPQAPFTSLPCVQCPSAPSSGSHISSTLYAFQLSDNLFSYSFLIPSSSPPSHTLFFVQSDAGLPRRTVASLAPLYIKEAESTAADGP